MTLTPSLDFCTNLFSHGLIRINSADVQPVKDISIAQDIIKNIDAVLRDNAPGSPPAFDLEAACWGLAVIEWGSDLLVDRKQSETRLPPLLQEREPLGNTPAQHWSVDIGLRFLTDLIKKVSTAAPSDSLLESLNTIAGRWPLSSVGADVKWNEERLNIILSDKSLELLLMDRIWQRADTTLKSHPLLKDRLARHLYLPKPHLQDRVS